MSSSRPLVLLLAICLAASALVAPLLPLAAAASHLSPSACAQAIQGCMQCTEVAAGGGSAPMIVCARCQSGAIPDPNNLTRCICESGYGTISRIEFETGTVWRCSLPLAPPDCRQPYSTVQGRCVQCSLYRANSVNGVCRARPRTG